MDRLETMRIFVAVAEAEGFAQAARRLAMSPPAVTRAISALEKRVGTRLLHRTTRVVRLTEAGAHFLADCKRILGEIEEAERSAAGSHTEPRGRLTVTASLMFGRLYVAPLLIDFLARYPQVTVRAVFADRVVDLIEEGIDVAIRIAHLTDSSFTATKVGSVRRVLCASPAYLKARGTPRSPRELAEHDCVVFSQDASTDEWAFSVRGTPERVRLTPRFFANSAEVAIAAAVAGRGLTRVLSYQAAEELAAGRLQIVLADYEPQPIPVSVVIPEGRRAAAKVRAFVELAVEGLRVRLR
jgi:DNA-binding transcriptional LysR family regulator